ncbi:1-acylglycerol-3-phosphate O-acyltransferase [Alteromonas oceanisediminis]|uniref:1-acylglycerol-3-phosphate O-acyltransferase n=1 Tax=Alteromonas oceanisediminis TaxID=2836180 RepID=UPI001BD9979E|nr:1-acylglycerol-3-phosphate O-acyltransferase [Alteromonas oceanisediminis]MBT0585429.1 1-acylglycerol-3-phosphate O-acyltransferase [Alteromonas oceanisediminis]
MLAAIRIIAIFFYFLIINLLLIAVCIVRPFHRNNVHIAGQVYSTMSFFLGTKLVMRTSGAIQADVPYVFIANHQNSYDLLTICKAALPGVVTVGKKSLKWIPLFGQLYWLSGNILIDRKNTGKARDTLSLTAEKMRERRLSVWFFPEGTRSYGRGLLPFKTGAFRLAMNTNEKIVMVCASSTHKTIKLNRWNNGTVLIDILPPLTLDDSKTAKEWAEHCHTIMKQHIEKLDDEVAQLAATR